MKTSKSTFFAVLALCLLLLTLAVMLLLSRKNEIPDSAAVAISNAELTQTHSPSEETPVKLIEEVNFPSKGSVNLELAQSEVAVGIAEQFQDEMGKDGAPYTIFVVYGPVSADVAMLNGAWKIWANAGKVFIQNAVDERIAGVAAEPRGYRVVECHEQVVDCTTVRSAP